MEKCEIEKIVVKRDRVEKKARRKREEELRKKNTT